VQNRADDISNDLKRQLNIRVSATCWRFRRDGNDEVSEPRRVGNQI